MRLLSTLAFHLHHCIAEALVYLIIYFKLHCTWATRHKDGDHGSPVDLYLTISREVVNQNITHSLQLDEGQDQLVPWLIM